MNKYKYRNHIITAKSKHEAIEKIISAKWDDTTSTMEQAMKTACEIAGVDDIG